MGALFLLTSFLCSLILSAGEDIVVTCVSSEHCVLPCKFNPIGKGVRVMWYKKNAVVTDTRYGNTSWVVGHNSPANRYKDRTDMDPDRVLQGNAALVLKNVMPQDEGKYFCITIMQPRTDESAVVSLKVRAPVEDVHMDVSNNSVKCRAEGIYPTPTLTWSTDPPMDTRLLQSETRFTKSQLGFYTVKSSVQLVKNDSVNQTYICTVTSAMNRRTTHLKQEAWIQTMAGRNINVSCSLPYSPLVSFNLTWWFRNSEPILTINVTGDKSQMKFFDEWSHHVYDNRMAVRRLALRNLTTDYQGTYTCEVTTPEERFVTMSNVGIREDFQLMALVPSIVLVSFFFLSYCAIAFLLVKLQKTEQENTSIDGSETSLTLSSSEKDEKSESEKGRFVGVL